MFSEIAWFWAPIQFSLQTGVFHWSKHQKAAQKTVWNSKSDGRVSLWRNKKGPQARSVYPPETNSKFAPENGPSDPQKQKMVFQLQPSIFLGANC